MPDRPVVPSRIIPAGQPLPDLPGRTPGPEDLPPWHTTAPPKPPAPPPPAPPPAEREPDPEPQPVHVTVVLAPQPEPEPEQPSWWQRLAPRIAAWKIVLALVLALAPIPWTGYSAATTWAYTVGEAREIAMWLGYTAAFGAFGLAAAWLMRSRRALALTALAVAFVGLFGAIHWYDPITWLTGATL